MAEQAPVPAQALFLFDADETLWTSADGDWVGHVRQIGEVDILTIVQEMVQ